MPCVNLWPSFRKEVFHLSHESDLAVNTNVTISRVSENSEMNETGNCPTLCPQISISFAALTCVTCLLLCCFPHKIKSKEF